MNSSTLMSYLGKKGYTVKKNTISNNEQMNIRKKLTVRPYVPNSPVKGDEFEVTNKTIMRKQDFKTTSKVLKYEKWSDKYKKSIDCDNPKGFSQKAHCQGRNK